MYIINSSNYSGKKLTGIARSINVSGIDANFQGNYSLQLMLNCTSSIPLNDANTAFAKPYQLLQVKTEKNFVGHKNIISIYAGVDNILNERYSLGNDLNAFGERYYNAAPSRNFFAGVKNSAFEKQAEMKSIIQEKNFCKPKKF